MTYRYPQWLLLAAALCLLAACSSANDDSAGAQASSPGVAPPTLRIPDVLPGSGATSVIQTRLPGGITPGFEYRVTSEIQIPGQERTVNITLETPLEARDAIERLHAQFTRAGLDATAISEQRKRKTNVLTAYAATFSSPGEGGVTAIAGIREEGPTLLTLAVRQP